MECLVEYDYNAQEPDELTIKKGDILKNVVTKMDGWWEGSLRGVTGIFPDNFVKVIEKPDLPDDPSPSPSLSKRVEVLVAYRPQQDDELALEIGDVLDVIEEVEEGWWRGRLNGKEGIFPSNFVSEVDESKMLNGSMESLENFSDDESTRISSGTELKADERVDEVLASIPNQEIDDDSVPELPPNPIGEQFARCFFPYRAMSKDELSLAVGDVITVISKNCEDEGWWSGELGGKIGVFPDTFVKIIDPGEIHSEPKVDTQPESNITAEQSSHPPQITVQSPSEELVDNDNKIEVSQSVGADASNSMSLDQSPPPSTNQATMSITTSPISLPSGISTDPDHFTLLKSSSPAIPVVVDDDVQVKDGSQLISESVDSMSNHTTKSESGNNLPHPKGDNASNSNSKQELATLLGEINTRIISLEYELGALRKQLKVLLKRNF